MTHPARATVDGLVIAYRIEGPPDAPVVTLSHPLGATHRLWDDHALGYVRDCNWLQHFENAADPYHLVVLHEMISGDYKIGRPRQLYTGPAKRDYIPINKR